MARRGRFGRRRTGSTNLTALITQLIREQRAAEDRVMFDAYENGGLVDGKPVDDARLLKYVKGRRDSFSKDDPLYDEWGNRLIQLEFKIGEQEIGLKFQQGKVGAGAVAAFYRQQLKDIPRNSAFYREVAGRAAQWAKSVAGAARGRARGRATSGLRASLNSQLEKQQTYLGLEAALTAYARREGLISGSEDLADADATDLRAMFDRGIYSGTDRITFGDFTSAARDHYKALTSEINTRLQLGQQAVEARDKQQRFLNDTLVRLNAIPEREQYETARDHWLGAVSAANGDPYAIAKANEAYAKTLSGIQVNATTQDGLASNDPEFIGGLGNEIKAILTGEYAGDTVADIYDMDDDAGGGKDQAESTAALFADIELLDSGKAYYGQTEPGGALGVVQWPSGTGTNPLGLDNSLQPSISSLNGEKRLVYLKGAAVSSSVILDANGLPVDPANLSAEQLRLGLSNGDLSIESGGNVGYVFTNPSSGEVKYGVIDQTTGQMFFTEENPFSSETVNIGTGLTVFGGARETTDGEFVPDPATALVKPVDITNADPLLSDSTVAPKDLLALATQGVVGLTEEQNALYLERLRTEQRQRFTAQAQADRGFQDRMLDGGGRQVEGGGDLASNTLSLMRNIQSVTRSLVPDMSRDTGLDFLPPEAPKLGAVPLAAPTAALGAGLSGIQLSAAAPSLAAAAGAAATTLPSLTGGAAAGALLGVGGTQTKQPELTGGATAGALLGVGAGLSAQPKPKPKPTPKPSQYEHL